MYLREVIVAKRPKVDIVMAGTMATLIDAASLEIVKDRKNSELSRRCKHHATKMTPPTSATNELCQVVYSQTRIST